MNAIVPLQLNVLVIDKSSKGSICTIWQLCTLNITSFGSKARSAKLWELSSQGTEISPQDCQIGIQRPRLTTNDRYLANLIFSIRHSCNFDYGWIKVSLVSEIPGILTRI